jgi:1-acyl-sn-glycerol-3-phosphate acyltransferase
MSETSQSRAKRHAQRNDTPEHAPRPENNLPSRILQCVNRMYARVYHRLEVISPSRLPPSGPGIIVCNHTSGLDPHLVQSACRRLISWMMAREYYEIRMIKPMLDAMGTIPVSRNGRDMSATRAAMRALARGQMLGIFPEGRIEPTRQLLPFQTGAAMMAIKTGVPVFPAYLDGTQRGHEMLAAFFCPHRARVIFGDPVQFPRSGDMHELLATATSAIEHAVADLKAMADAHPAL